MRVPSFTRGRIPAKNVSHQHCAFVFKEMGLVCWLPVFGLVWLKKWNPTYVQDQERRERRPVWAL